MQRQSDIGDWYSFKSFATTAKNISYHLIDNKLFIWFVTELSYLHAKLTKVVLGTGEWTMDEIVAQNYQSTRNGKIDTHT